MYIIFCFRNSKQYVPLYLQLYVLFRLEAFLFTTAENFECNKLNMSRAGVGKHFF